MYRDSIVASTCIYISESIYPRKLERVRGCNNNVTKCIIRFSWVTLPLLSISTAHKAVHTGIISCRSSYIESIIHFYSILQGVRERLLGQIRSFSTMRALEDFEQLFILYNPCKEWK